MNNDFYTLSLSTSLLKMPGLPTLRKLRGDIDGYGDAQQGVKARRELLAVDVPAPSTSA